MAHRSFDENKTEPFTRINSTLFNKRLSDAHEGMAVDHVLLHRRRSFFMKNFTHQKGPSRGIGGAIFVTVHSQMFVTNCVFEANSAQRVAGAICATFYATLDIQETTFVGNNALSGDAGAIDVEQQVHLQVTNCVFTDNSAQHLAGSIDAFQFVTLNIEGTTFVGNNALQGGAIDIQDQVHLSITNCTFKDNSAQLLAAAVSAEQNVTFNVQETTFVGNKALGGDGGAISVQNQVHLSVTSCTFKGNSAHFNAGAIASSQSVTLNIECTAVVGNRASQGGAINAQHQAHCTFEDNSAEDLAGAIGAMQNVTINIQGTRFVGNKASSDSGAINMRYQTHLRVTYCVFKENVSLQGPGGAINAAHNATSEIQETNFMHDIAVQGGAIHVQKQCHLRVADSTFEDNRAEQIGGAIGGALDLVCKIYRSYFYNNRATQQGGAINVQENTDVLIANSILKRNVASDAGGGIMVADNVTLKLRETNFAFNKASTDGGTLVLLTQIESCAELCVFHSNSAKTGDGGAVYIDSRSSLKIENNNFTNNNSTDGGALHVRSNSKLQTKMCSFCKNLAAQDGGAIHLTGYSSAVIESCHFLSNHAGSGGALEADNVKCLSIRGTLLLKNVASSLGGAITIGDTNNVTINNITCVGNQGANGGCLYIDTATLTLSNSEISDNVGQYDASVTGLDSTMQVSSVIFSLTLFTLLNFTLLGGCGSTLLVGFTGCKQKK